MAEQALFKSRTKRQDSFPSRSDGRARGLNKILRQIKKYPRLVAVVDTADNDVVPISMNPRVHPGAEQRIVRMPTRGHVPQSWKPTSESPEAYNQRMSRMEEEQTQARINSFPQASIQSEADPTRDVQNNPMQSRDFKSGNLLRNFQHIRDPNVQISHDDYMKLEPHLQQIFRQQKKGMSLTERRAAGVAGAGAGAKRTQKSSDGLAQSGKAPFVYARAPRAPLGKKFSRTAL